MVAHWLLFIARVLLGWSVGLPFRRFRRLNSYASAISFLLVCGTTQRTTRSLCCARALNASFVGSSLGIAILVSRAKSLRASLDLLSHLPSALPGSQPTRRSSVCRLRARANALAFSFAAAWLLRLQLGRRRVSSHPLAAAERRAGAPLPPWRGHRHQLSFSSLPSLPRPA